MQNNYNFSIAYSEEGFTAKIGNKRLVSGSLDRLCELIANEADNQFRAKPTEVCLSVCLKDVLPVNAV